MANYPYKIPGTQLDDFRQGLIDFIEAATGDIKRIENDMAAVTGIFKWVAPVGSENDLETSYPDATKGWAAMTTDTGKVYLYNGSSWEYVQQIDAGPANALASLFNEQLLETVKKNDTGVLDLNVFDEATRSILQGLLPGTINAVLGKGNVTPENTSFMEYTKNLTNFFNRDSVELGYYSRTTGRFIATDTVYTTPVISVIPGDTVTFISLVSGTHHVSYWDADGEFAIEGPYPDLSPNTPISYTIPAGVFGFRIALREEDLDSFQILISDKGVVTKTWLKGVTIDAEHVEFIETIERVNIFDKNAAHLGDFYRASDGAYLASGTAGTSGFMPVENGDVIRFKSIIGGNYQMTVWDENQEYLYGTQNVKETGEIVEFNVNHPQAKFFVTALRNGELNEFMVTKNRSVPEEYHAYQQQTTYLKEEVSIERHLEGIKEPGYWEGKKVIFQGDSITDPAYGAYTERWPKIVSDELGLITIGNYAKSGSVIAINPDSPTSRTPIISRYEEMSNDADLVIVAAGTNDWRYDWSPMGEETSRDNTTFYGALNNLCLGLKKKYPGAHILFLTPIMRKQGDYSEPTSVNANGVTLQELGDIMAKVCRSYSISTLDMYGESGLYPFDDELADLYMPDRTHPNDAGQIKMARPVIGRLKQMG